MCAGLPQRIQLSGPLPRERHAAPLVGGAGGAPAAPRLPGHHRGRGDARDAPERHLQLPGRLPQQVGGGHCLVHSPTTREILRRLVKGNWNELVIPFIAVFLALFCGILRETSIFAA